MWQTFLGSDYSGIVHYIALHCAPLHCAPLHCALCIVTLPLVFALLRELWNQDLITYFGRYLGLDSFEGFDLSLQDLTSCRSLST